MGARGRRKERRARARTTGRRGEGAGGAQAGARDLSFAGRLPHPGGKSRRRTDAAASRGPAPERSAPGRGSGGGEGRETGPRGRGTAPPNDPRGSPLSLSARTGRARGGGGRAGPAGGQAGSRLPPHRRRGERPRRRGFPPPLAPRHPTGPRRRVPTAGESGRGRERERRSARGRSREEGRPAARRRRAGRTRPARTRGARANAGRRPRLNFGRRRAPGSGALRADSQPRDAIPPAAAKPQGGAAIDRQATLRQA